MFLRRAIFERIEWNSNLTGSFGNGEDFFVVMTENLSADFCCTILFGSSEMDDEILVNKGDCLRESTRIDALGVFRRD